uniref:Uncharacterized protein n=1 Tax=Acrobeloides nanus TaxID=290746 RepID=A0A914D7Y9_9BILA
MNDTFMMKIYSDLFLNSNDFLSISTCDTQNIMFDSNVSTSNHNSFYTQEEEICIKFISSNNTEENNLFFWNVQFLLFPSPLPSKNEGAYEERIPCIYLMDIPFRIKPIFLRNFPSTESLLIFAQCEKKLRKEALL